jgi:4'-phosphopantetheinyl transferase
MMISVQSCVSVGDVSTTKSVLREFKFPEYPLNAVVPVLEQNEVHVWFADKSCDPHQRAEYETLLSRDELHRMARFRFEADREAFVFAHGFLRSLLATYLHLSPGELHFDYSDHAKPSISQITDVQFNLSHTDGAVLVGLCRDRQIGVDIEKVRSHFELMSIAARFFTPSECESLLRLPEPVRVQAFFHCWTRKEAVLKARGDGLSFPLDRVEVSVISQEAVVGVPSGTEEQRWRVMPLNVPADYVAAVAVIEI